MATGEPVKKQKIKLLDVKQALLDDRFRAALPEELNPEIAKFLQNPGCACNHPIYRKVMKLAGKQLADYYPTKEPTDPDEIVEKLSQNEWTVINCSIHELASKLRNLGPGRKQVDVARWEDQVTVVINELDIMI